MERRALLSGIAAVSAVALVGCSRSDDGPSPDAIGAAARQTGLPVDRVTEVRVLDPYFYHP